jgi:non-specific serine/threonine protein kinase/serine/threonine-protein kinase
MVMQRLVDKSPPAPSDAVLETSPVSRRQLRGDLDAIAAKALRQESAQRYPDARALADDLRRHLEHEPVKARRGARAYVLRRFLRRHWLPVGATAIVVIALGIAVVGIAWQARVAAFERDAARTQLDRASVTTGFLVNLFRDNTQVSVDGRQMPIRDLLSERVALARGAGTYDTAEWLVLLHGIGDLHVAFGDYVSARPLYEEYLRDAGSHASDVDAATVRIALANVEMKLGNFASGLPLAQSAKTFFGSDPSRFAQEFTRALHVEAQLMRRLGDHEGALHVLRELVEVNTRLEGALADRTMSYANSLAISYLDMGRIDEAEAVLANARAYLATGPAEMGGTAFAVMNTLASIDEDRGRYADAEAGYRRVYDALVESQGRSLRTAQVLLNVARTLDLQGKREAAAAVFADVEHMATEYSGPDSEVTLRARLGRINNLFHRDQIEPALAQFEDLGPKLAGLPPGNDIAISASVLGFRVRLAAGRIVEPERARRDLDAQLAAFGDTAGRARKELAGIVIPAAP